MVANRKPIPSEADITRLTGHNFPGGFYTVAHWENFLLTECTGAALLPDGLVHPVALFHMPIVGAGTSIAEMFALGQGKRTINQGPLGLSYIINMLQAWGGPDCLRRIVMRFPQVVLDGERVVARGEISVLREEQGVWLADCSTRLEHDDRGVLLAGTATIVLPENAILID